jgi:hypothetical protein
VNWGVWAEDDTAHRDRQSSKERYTHDLSRMARTCKHIAAVVCPLEQRAGCIDVDPSANSDALALLLKALTLLEKALSVSEDATTSQLQEEYAQTLHLAGACHARFGSDPPAGRPHGLILEFAMRQAKDAAVDLDQGKLAQCRSKLEGASLLIDLLLAEADGTDAQVLRTYAKHISELLEPIAELEASGAVDIAS